ncbi:protocatechuate 3,4-dioxygenase beta subunit [Eremomyces bilateralis CBS 781.70]|uniref:Protocatechuate 3,4-dioxygenase beta subunit n=1 Tax=Eremomyces bilateralis CBS 781.70 TaxID=1392243 RepID=A0A6G1GEX2_9PEZI|nr:protocatechuate 3,4-dioxygenase beta subunit [Eremomyces bilateralis CBS 781.70]KAF1816552.1 protocatechuate 3,4-dioxygenase beta subunit [Eremomyces bilateralis CBS 781.70]
MEKITEVKNGVDGPLSHVLGQDFTQHVKDSIGPKASPRVRSVLQSLTQHMHDFWMSAIELINESGKFSTPDRNETQLLCDLLGLESLIDSVEFSQQHSRSNPTLTAILGPVYRQNPPAYPYGASIIQHSPETFPETAAMTARIFGRITDADTDAPIPGAEVDFWQCAPNGLYDIQDPQQPYMNLRGLSRSRATPYPIPEDGPGGKFPALMDRQPYRPGHLHFWIRAEGYRSLITQVFERGGEFLENDSVFAVKGGLCVQFEKEERGGRLGGWSGI